MGRSPDVEASVYLGAAHNRYHIERLTLSLLRSRYRFACSGVVEFSREGGARDERVDIVAVAVYRRLALPHDAADRAVSDPERCD